MSVTLKMVLVRQVLAFLMMGGLSMVVCQTSTPILSSNSTQDMGNQTTATAALQTQPETTTLTTLQTDTYPDPIISFTDDLIVCVCDLTQNQCDINCCCDAECTAADRLVFSGCTDQLYNDPVESRLCSYTVKVFRDNSVTEETVNNPNLFCLWRDGKTSRNYYTVTELAKTNEQYSTLAEQADNSYSYQYQAQTVSVSNTSAYKNGEVLLSMNTAGRISVLSVPSALASTSMCIDSTPAQFLLDRTSHCNRALPAKLGAVCETTASLNAYRYADNLNNLQVLPTTSEGLTAGLNLVVNWGHSTPLLNVSAGLCFNVLTQVDYLIMYKSGVIVEVKATLNVHDLPIDVTSVSQTNTIKYVDVNAADDTYSRSGNPGYLVGRPLLAGIRVENFITLNGDNNQYLTMVTASANGDCQSDSLNRRQILFGENFRSGCIVRATLDDLDNHCELIQAYVIEAMLGPTRTLQVDGSLYIASFGNSDPLRIGDWIQVIVANEVVEGSCKGVATHLEILYADHGELHNPQARIVGAKLTFEPIEFEFLCVQPYCESNANDISQQFEMVTSVSFVDVTKAPVQAFAEKPVVKSKLPANFFHPYYLSAGIQTTYPVSLLVLLLVFHCVL